MFPVMHKRGYNFRHLLFPNYILILAHIKREINAHIFIDHSSAITFNGKPFLLQLVQIPSDGFLRDSV